MARSLRIEQCGGYFHVFTRGIERRVIFPDEESRKDFLERLAELPSRFGVSVHGYVLMENHFHLLLRPQGLNLSRAVHWLNAGYCIWFNRKHKRCGPLFQGRFKSVLIGDRGQLHEISRYLHLNPVRTAEFGLDSRRRKAREKGKGLPLKPETVRRAIVRLNDFPWSSYRAYAGLALCPNWLSPSWVKGMNRREYRRYVEQGVRMGMPSNPFDEGVIEGYLGTRKAWQKLKEQVRGNRGEQKALRQEEGLLKWEIIVAALERLEGKPWIEFCGIHGNSSRDMGLLAGRKHGRMSLVELGEKAEGMKYPAVSEAVRRMERKVKNERDVRKKWAKLIKLLNI